MDYNTFYTNAAQNYNDSRLDEGAVFDYTVEYIVSHLHSKNLNILDVGCGTGEYAAALIKLGYNVQGIDKSLAQVRIASQKIPAFQGDILSLTQPDDSVDIILMIMMIHQIADSDIDKAFSELARVLKSGGLVIIKTCFESDIENRITSRYFPSCLSFDKSRFHNKKRLFYANENFVPCSCDKVTIPMNISKDRLVEKLLLRGASNIGMISEEELNQGIVKLLNDYSNQDIIELSFDNTFLILKRL